MPAVAAVVALWQQVLVAGCGLRAVPSSSFIIALQLIATAIAAAPAQPRQRRPAWAYIGSGRSPYRTRRSSRNRGVSQWSESPQLFSHQRFPNALSCTDCSWRGRERLLSTTVVAQVVLVGARKASVVSKHAMSICDACRRAPDAPHTRPTPASLLPGYAPCGPGCPGRPHRTVMTTREPPLSSVTGIPHAAVSSGGEAQDSGVCLRACATV